MIRAAHLGDVPAIYVLGRRIHQKSDDRDIPMDQAKARGTVAAFISDKRGIVLVDEVDGMLTGLLVGYTEEFWYSKKRFAMPFVIYAERPGAFNWMLRRFITWAFEQKCAVQIPLDCSFGGKLGAKTVEVLRAWTRSKHEQPWLLEEVGASFTVRKRP